MTTGNKQMNYPRLNQYIHNNILIGSVEIDNDTGILYEVMAYFGVNNDTYFHDMLYKKHQFICYDKCHVRRINIDKPWFIQLNDIFNYEQQEILEKSSKSIGKKPFPKDICFITRVPLYDRFFIFTVGKKEKSTIVNKHKIAISPIALYKKYKHKGRNIPIIDFITIVTNYIVLSVEISSITRNLCDVINMIPNDKISEQKRKLLLCIHKNGIYLNNNVYITLNMEDNILYVGSSNIYDIDIIKYKKTNVRLFNKL
jgi:hypothetical protein